MNRFGVSAWLDWWANPSTLLASVPIELTIVDDAPAWTATGRLTSEDQSAGFAFLCGLDPVFQLRFADGSLVTVSVDLGEDAAEFTLREHHGPAWREIAISFPTNP